MIVIRELIQKGEISECIRYDPESVQGKRWGWFLLGCAGGSVVYRLYTRIFQEIYTFSGDSNITLFLGLTAFTGVDASAGYLLSPAIKMEGRSIPHRVLLWTIYIALLFSVVNYFGPLKAIRGLIVFTTLRHGNNANVDFMEMVDICQMGPVAFRLQHDEEFAQKMAEKMVMPFGHLGFVVGGCLQMFLPLKVTCSGIVIYLVDGLIRKAFSSYND